MVQFIYIKFYDRSNNRSKYADGLYNSMIDDKNDGGMIASWYTVIGYKLLTSLGVADNYTCLLNTWNTIPESYQHRVYKNTIATVKHQIQQAENPTAAMMISVEAARVDHTIVLEYLTSKVALEEPEIGRTDTDILIYNNCTDDELHCGMPGCRRDLEQEGDESDEHYAIPTPRRWWQATTGLERFDLGTSDVVWYEGQNGNDPGVDQVEEALQADNGSSRNVEDWGYSKFDLVTSNVDRYEGEDGNVVVEEEEALQAVNRSTQNVDDCGHSTRQCEDWTVYFRPVRYDHTEANAMASDVSVAKTDVEQVTTSQS